MLRTSAAAGIAPGLPFSAIGAEKADPVESLSPQEAVRLVSAGIRSNYDSLKTVHAKMQTVMETPSADDKDHHQDVVSDGRIVGRDTTSNRKRIVEKAEVWLT